MAGEALHGKPELNFYVHFIKRNRENRFRSFSCLHWVDCLGKFLGFISIHDG